MLIFRKNCKSLLKHYKMFECCQNANGSHHPISNEWELGPVSDVKNMQYVLAIVSDWISIEGVDHAVSVKWLAVNGNKYVSSMSHMIHQIMF